MNAPSRWANDAWTLTRWRTYQDVFSFPATLVLLSLLLGSALVLIVRRSAGALSEPLSAGTLILSGMCIAVAVVGTRYLSRRIPFPRALALHWMLEWGPTLAVAMFAVALAIDGTSMPAMAIYLALIVGAEFFAERGAWILGKSRAAAVGFKLRRKAKVAVPCEQPLEPAELDDSPSTDDEPIAVDLPEQETQGAEWERAPAGENLEELPEAILEGAWQQITRARTPEGELITGWVKAEFQPGERTAVLHVAFCPPLQQAPEVEIEQLSGPAARIKAAQVLPQGARFEIRLNVPAVESETLMLAFVAAGELSGS